MRSAGAVSLSEVLAKLFHGGRSPSQGTLHYTWEFTLDTQYLGEKVGSVRGYGDFPPQQVC
jgi:hypothetical protein